jgi:hypothetical protein
MALEPLDPANTARYFLDYTHLDVAHTLIMRENGGNLLSDVQSGFDAFLTAIAPSCSPIVTVGLRFANEGSNVTNPVDLGGIASSYGTQTENDINRPLQVTFTGRSTDGRKTRVGLFGWVAQTDLSWRISTAESSVVADALEVLGTLTFAGMWVTISGLKVSWHAYMNIAFNDHFVKKARTGG